MKLGEIFNPWAAMREAREKAEQLSALLRDARRTANRAEIRLDAARQVETRSAAVIEELTTIVEAASPMLEELAAIKARRSKAVSIGNRKRAQKRRGELLPAPINDTAGTDAPHLRTALTG